MSRRVSGEFQAAITLLSIWAGLLTAWFPAASATGQLIDGYRAGSLSPELTAASDGTSVLVFMSRGQCFGSCPVYSVGIGGSGLVEYQGRRFVRIEGRHSGRIPESAVDELRAAIDSADFFSLEDSYPPCLDVSSIFVYVEIGGARKSVESSPSCYRSRNTVRGVSAQELRDVDLLRELHRNIDRLAGTEKWVGTREQREQKRRAEREALRIARDATIAELEARFDAGDPMERRQTAVELLRYDSRVEEALPIALKILEEADEEARRKAASGIKQVVERQPPPDRDLGASRDEIVSALTAALGDSNPAVRSEAALALGWMGPDASAVAASIAVLLRDEQTSVRAGALNALLRLGPYAGPAAQGLVDALPRAVDWHRSMILGLLGVIGAQYATISLPVLVGALQDPDESTRFEAARSLGRLKIAASSSLDSLTEVAGSDPDERVRRAATDAIAAIEGN